MKYKLFFLVIVFGGCISPSAPIKEVHQRAAEQVMLLIDSGYLQNQYVEIVETASNDSSMIYAIRSSNSALSYDIGLPSRVITYKGKHLCFIELDEPEMSLSELSEIGIAADSSIQPNSLLLDDELWFLGLRKYENKQTLVKENFDYSYDLVEYPELWPYLSGDSPSGKPLLMTLNTHDIIAPDSLLSCVDSLKADSMKHYIDRFWIEISIKKQTDSTIVLSKNKMQDLVYAVINGKDTLRFIPTYSDPIDSLPTVMDTYYYCILRLNSEPPHKFLEKLPDQDTWMAMYKLFCDSTFCFLEINGKPMKIRLLHNDARTFSHIKLNSELNCEPWRQRYAGRTFYNKNAFNEEIRSKRLFGL